MGESTEIREKVEGELREVVEEAAKGGTGYKKLVLTIGAALTPIIGYIFQDMYFTMKSTSTEIAELRTEVAEVRSSEIDKMWEILNTFRKDIAENKIRLEVLDRLYGANSYDMDYESSTAEDLEWEIDDLREMQLEMMQRFEERLLKDFEDMDDEVEQYREMEQQFQEQMQQEKK
jgi:hypothetical protein